ncbi:hypothetical protein TRFO_31294 [Tritrichomonas foetus]|uniref:Uncharacterized protein n=1 Tax=Tritrichomonas foetus TaxID=1144522 RepID=A0A1J4JWT9_9EUKA|nr:hypothetical protein TRFO_31294 [Tritrichomonas foetus]|eukprot:OHT01741.1 hypothetical protein TRFO_31294 [Tritrichomonas foetus]
MNSDLYEKLQHVVPNVPEILLEDCSSRSAQAREEIIQQQRIATIIPLIREDSYPTALIPPRDDLFSIIHSQPDDIMLSVTPQQIQYVALLTDFILKNPSHLVKALESQFDQDHNKFFIFMCFSVIPSFYGFFSSNELIYNAFSFYCSLVNIKNEKVIDYALIPFYCNACTYRFIEMIYCQFGLQFCHDIRLDSPKTQTEVLKMYVEPLINTIIQSFPLLPQTHIFLLKFMIRRGRNPKSVLHFFLHRFTLPQLLRYVKGTPFTSHFNQLKALAISLRDDITPCTRILSIMDSTSLFEVPSAFSVFDAPFTQLLVTPCDVHIMINALQQVTELPTHLKSFKENTYFSHIDMTPFWVKLYSRNPKPFDTTFNWRPVVFPNYEITIDNSNPEFERTYRRMKSSEDSNKLLEMIKKSDQEKHKEFKKYIICKDTQNLIDRSRTFERYLVHSMSLRTLTQWQSVVQGYYTTMVLPIAQQKMMSLLKKKFTPTVESIESIVNESLQGACSPIVRQTLFMMVINHLLNAIVPSELMKKLDRITNQWDQHIMLQRESIVLPDMFRNGPKRSVLLMNQKLWAAIEHLKCIKHIKFEWSLKLILDALMQLDELIRIGDSESTTVVQFAVAFCDCSLIIYRFMIINIFVVKQKTFLAMTNENTDLFLWSRLESAFLKLMASDDKLMTSFLALQDDLMAYQIK